jgi:hypothetical protein
MGRKVEWVFITTQEQFADDLFGARKRCDFKGVDFDTGAVFSGWVFPDTNLPLNLSCWS